MNGKLMLRCLALALVGCGGAPVHAQGQEAAAAVHQEVDFQASPARIYDALLDAKQFAAFTKDTAELQRLPGGHFQLFGGRIEGRNVELVSNQRIVQAWRSSAWPAGNYTIVRFQLVARGSGTRIIFDQGGVLDDRPEWKQLEKGWPSNYWEPLRKYLGK
jgi:activator of HSP90 ATPase